MNKVSLKEKFGYGVGAIGLDLSYGLFYSFLSKYLQSVLGISSLFLLILAPIARLWDGINDPMMGTIVDRTNTKFGKYRPWILIGAVLNAVVLCLLFNNPGISTDSAGIYVYVTIFYVLWGMTNTLADIPYWSMIPSFSNQEKERSLISTIARTFSGLGQGIILIGTPIVLKYLGSDKKNIYNAQGFSRWTFIAAGLLIVFAFVSVISTHERNIIPKKAEKFSLKNSFKIIKNNDQLLVFMLFAMISNAGFYMTSGIVSYYFADVCENTDMQSTFTAMGAVGSILGLLVIPVCSSVFKKSNRQTYKISLSMAIAGYIGMFIVGTFIKGTNIAVLLGLFYLITSIGIGSMFVNQTVMLADVVDYGEYKSGRRDESLTFSMKGFLQKMAYTLQCIIMYSLFLITGYKESSSATIVHQTVAAKGAISSLMYVIPPILFLISLVIFIKKFKVHGEFKNKMISELNERHETIINNND